eukprot:NODE_2856_length_2131_cov_5.697605.p1 GENE.NODE_2856_length_2131_cov_5.697605~~NODE_2856_length_2131_cov_5.697605.p1  ORF type:complete len:362 (+),score=78.10 NODE_2856_length_2131_cov_5.697605:263-1348(+)
MDLEGVHIKGLRNQFHFGYSKDQHEAVGICRDICYSNIECQYWLYGNDGCWTEEPAAQYTVEYPLTSTSAVPSPSVYAGEFIQHYCPALPEDVREDFLRRRTSGSPWWWWWARSTAWQKIVPFLLVLAALAVLAFSVAAVYGAARCVRCGCVKWRRKARHMQLSPRRTSRDLGCEPAGEASGFQQFHRGMSHSSSSCSISNDCRSQMQAPFWQAGNEQSPLLQWPPCETPTLIDVRRQPVRPLAASQLSPRRPLPPPQQPPAARGYDTPSSSMHSFEAEHLYEPVGDPVFTIYPDGSTGWEAPGEIRAVTTMAQSPPPRARPAGDLSAVRMALAPPGSGSFQVQPRTHNTRHMTTSRAIVR